MYDGRAQHASFVHKFTANERDSESGLDEFGARYYSSALGRFMIPDWADAPTVVPYANFGNPQSLNLYAYVGNNPLNTTDLDGHCCTIEGALEGAEIGEVFGPWGAVAGAVIGGVAGTFVAYEVGDKAGSALANGSGPVDVGDCDTAGCVAGTRLGQALYKKQFGDKASTPAQPQKDQSTKQAEQAPGGGKNEQKSNPDRQKSAKDDLKKAKTERDELRSKPNKTPEDKAKLEKLENQVKHLQKRLLKSPKRTRGRKGAAAMTENRLYTIVLDYKGGTYIGQAHANSVTKALSEWLSGIGDQELAEWKITRDELSDIVSSDAPVPLSDRINVWCLSGPTKGGLALINVIATEG